MVEEGALRKNEQAALLSYGSLSDRVLTLLVYMATVKMSAADIKDAINSITEKKANLRKTFELLQSYSSSVASFTLQWKDIDDHISFIEKSILERFQEIKNLDTYLESKGPATASPSLKVEKKHDNQEPAADPPKVMVEKKHDKQESAASLPSLKVEKSHDKQEAAAALPLLTVEKQTDKQEAAQPRPYLKYLCSGMDGKGLLSFITDKNKKLASMRLELGSAFLCASDPVLLVLSSLESFVWPNKALDKDMRSFMRSSLTIMESLRGLSLEIKPEAQERARKLALKWKETIDLSGESSRGMLIFLVFAATFGLVESFEDYILDLIILVGWRKEISDLYRNSALVKKVPDLVDKFINLEKLLVAVRFVLAFNLQDKYAPSSLLHLHINNSRRNAVELRRRGNITVEFATAAIEKEIDEIQAVLKCVKKNKLESAFPCETLHKRLEQLNTEKIGLEKTAMQQENKRRATSFSDPSSNFMPSSAAPGLVDRVPRTEFTGSYSLNIAPTIYNHGNSGIPTNYSIVGAHPAPSGPFFHPPESINGPYSMAAMNPGFMPRMPPQPPYFP